MRLKSWASNAALAIVGLIAFGIVSGARVATQSPFLVFGSNAGVSQPINSTNQALWVSLQSVASNLIISIANLITTPTAGLSLNNPTLATAGVPVQMAPCLYLNDNVWNTTSVAANNTDQWTLCSVPVSGTTPSGLLKFGSSLNGGAATFPVTLSSAGVFSVVSGGGYGFAGVSNIIKLSGASTCVSGADGGCYLNVSTGVVQVNSAPLQLASGGSAINQIVGQNTAKLVQVLDSSGTTGLELNQGTPALGTCTGGTLTSGSHNFAGEITGNTSGSCVLNFGTPNFTNTPFCTLNDETSLVAAKVSARSASAITITGLTSGDAVQYICLGRIGT